MSLLLVSELLCDNTAVLLCVVLLLLLWAMFPSFLPSFLLLSRHANAQLKICMCICMCRIVDCRPFAYFVWTSWDDRVQASMRHAKLHTGQQH